MNIEYTYLGDYGKVKAGFGKSDDRESTLEHPQHNRALYPYYDIPVKGSYKSSSDKYKKIYVRSLKWEKNCRRIHRQIMTMGRKCFMYLLSLSNINLSSR